MGTATNSVAYTDQPVILISRSTRPGYGELVRMRLAVFFGVDSSDVILKEAAGFSCLYIRGLYIASFGASIHVDENSFTATAGPIVDASVTSAPTSSAIKEFVVDALEKAGRGQAPPSPSAFFHVDFDERRAWALNDSFGIGRVFWSDRDEVEAVSNNVAAVALAGHSLASSDTRFWDSYYTTGGAVGDCTYVESVHRALGGTSVCIDERGVVSKLTHSIESILLEARESNQEHVDPARAGAALIDAAKPFLKDRVSIGLSGGRDSRFVTAMALEADLNFQSFTAVPPNLEADIARQLHQASRVGFDWEIRDRRVLATTPSSTSSNNEPELMPIIERAEKWFRFSGGDCWPTFMRRNARQRKPVKLGAMAISGAFGDFARGHYYSEKDLSDPSGSAAVERFLGTLTRIRYILPMDIRRRGADNVRETFREMNDKGFEGFRSLDLSFIVNRQRRQLPHPAPNTLIPMLTSDMAAATFWDDPRDRVRAEGLRKMTLALRPEWEKIPYFHEMAVGTDPNVTNKVTIQPTYWEVDRQDFLDSVEHATEVNGFFDLQMDRVIQEIRDLPEGRNRTNVTFEFMFWHAGATKLLFDINRVLTSIL